MKNTLRIRKDTIKKTASVQSSNGHAPAKSGHLPIGDETLSSYSEERKRILGSTTDELGQAAAASETLMVLTSSILEFSEHHGGVIPAEKSFCYGLFCLERATSERLRDAITAVRHSTKDAKF